MLHQLAIIEEQDTQVVYSCTACNTVIGFVKEGNGTPCVTLQEGVWQLPDDWHQYADPCTGAPPEQIKQHRLIVKGETEQQVNFVCLDCNMPVGFVKPEFGSPHASLINGQWQPPDDFAKYMDVCDPKERPTEEQGFIDPETQSDQFRNPNNANDQT